MLTESNITNQERLYRNFINMVKAYCPKAESNSIQVEQTSKGDWRVFDETGKKICLVSKNILTDDIVAGYNIKKCSCE